jgi:hypothetical protein
MRWIELLAASTVWNVRLNLSGFVAAYTWPIPEQVD